jgi:hypothetical protein
MFARTSSGFDQISEVSLLLACQPIICYSEKN